MQQGSFYQMFVELLQDIFDAENQLVEALPKMAKAVTHTELKDALTEHWDETKNQVQRLKTIFKMLNENPTGVRCKAMQGLITEAQEINNKNYTPAVKDACFIIAAQKVEHYEIACYGSLRSLARHLNDAGFTERVDFDEIADLLQQSLEEESAADEKLTDIADGGFFSQGINDEAQKEQNETPKSGTTRHRSTNK